MLNSHLYAGAVATQGISGPDVPINPRYVLDAGDEDTISKNALRGCAHGLEGAMELPVEQLYLAVPQSMTCILVFLLTCRLKEKW